MARKRLLYITAFSLKQYGGIVSNAISLYENLGFEVDLLTLYNTGQKANHLYIFPRTREMKIAEIMRKFSKFSWLRKIYHLLCRADNSEPKASRYLKKGNNLVVLEDESKPKVCNDLIISKITKEYDYFILYGWQDMMSSSTVEALYDKFHKPIIIPCADMYQLTGNCFYTAGCEKYKDECRNCQVFADRPNKEQAHQNFLFKKRVYRETGCYVIANTHQKNYFLNSGIIDEEHILPSINLLNTELYKPLDRESCKKSLGLDQENFYLFVRYIIPSSTEYIRKGMNLLEESLNIFYSHLSDEERSRVVVMFAGVNQELCEVSYDFKTIAIGLLDIKNLIKAYNASSAFVCPSVDDAGPSMVNQSIACGTPVVAFNQGAALDVIEDGYNGYKAPLRDVEAFAQCIEKLFRLSEKDYAKMRENAREMSLRKNSREANYILYKKRFEYIDKHFRG